MNSRFPAVYPQKWSQIALLAGFCLFFYLVNLNQWDLWNPDEPRYAQVAREMVDGGDWILMHNNGKIYPDKPPLFFWLIGFSSFLFGGFSSFAARFPSGLFGMLTVLLTYFIGKRLYSSRTGLLAGLILATSVEFFYLATRANIDPTLTFFTTASFFCFVEWLRSRKDEKAGPDPSGRRWIYGFYVGMALATVTKGPVGFILPLLVTFVYLVTARDWRGLRKMKLLPGLILMVALILCWYLPASLRGGPQYLDATLFKHTIGRYSAGWSHVRPFYYYFINFPVDFMPWIFFLPGAIVYGLSKEMTGKRREFLFLLTWFAFIFLFFSISKGKRGLYLLPLYPAASLMVGKVIEDTISNQTENFRREWLLFPFYALMALMLIGGPALLWLVWKRFPSFLAAGVPGALLLMGGGVALFFLHRSNRHGAVFLLIVGIFASGFFYIQRVIFPLVNPLKSARFICREVTSQIQPGEKLAVHAEGTGPFNFYTGIVPIIELERLKDIPPFLESSERVFCLIRGGPYSSLIAKKKDLTVKVIARRQLSDSDILLISNR